MSTRAILYLVVLAAQLANMAAGISWAVNGYGLHPAIVTVVVLALTLLTFEPEHDQ